MALLRVMLWHATGWAPVTWVVAAIPAMFAVTGSLLVRSVERRGWRAAMWHRAVRLFPPLWLYSTVVVIASRLNGSHTSPLWTFYLPVIEPASTLGDGWFTTPLWYLRAYLWVLAVSPLLVWATKRFGAAVVAGGALTTVLIALRSDPHSRVASLVGDLFLYGTFTAAGMCFLARRRANRLALAATAILALAAGLLWLPGHRPADGIINHDRVAHLIVGAFSSASLLLVPGALSRLASWRYGAMLSRHSVTVYLWHSGVAWAVWHLQPAAWSHLVRASITFGATLAIVPLVVFAVGDVETRPERWWAPRRRLARLSPVLVTVALLAVPGVRGGLWRHHDPAGLPLPPSQAPVVAPVVVAAPVAEFVARETFVDEPWRKRGEVFQAVIDRANKDLGLKGLRAVVTTSDGHTWSGATADAKPLEQKSLVGSITKTFTATLVHRLIERGKLSLDSEVGDLGIGFKYRRLTVGQLLSHSSGLANFRSTKEFERDGVTPADILHWAEKRPLTFKPGVSTNYSSTGYLALGLLIEQVTGETYEDVLRREIVKPLHLDMDAWRSRYRSVGHATAGVSIGPAELARWGRLYFVDRSLTGERWDWRVRGTLGDGVQTFCPCEKGRSMALGYLGGRTMVSGDGDGVVVVLDATGILSGPNIKATQAYAQELRLLAGGGKTFAYQRG